MLWAKAKCFCASLSIGKCSVILFWCALL